MSSLPESEKLIGAGQLALGSPELSGAAPGVGGMNIGDAWRVIKRRKLLVAIAMVVCYALVVAATVLIWLFAPAYPSTAVLELKPPKEVFQVSEELVNPKFMEAALQTEAAKLKQLGLLQRVLAKPEVKATGFYKWYEGDFEECLYDLENMVHSAPIRDSYLIQVEFACRDKREARLIVNTIVQEYMRQYEQDHKDAAFEEAEGLKQTLTDLRNELANRREELARFRELKEVPAVQGQYSALAQYIGTLNQTLSNLALQRAALETQLAGIQGLDPRSLPVTPEMQIMVEADPILRYYRSRVEELDVQIKAAQHKQLGPNNRQIQQLQALRSGYYDKEVAKREELLDQLRARQIESLQQGLETVRTMQTQTLDQLADAEARQRQLNSNIQKYLEMTQDEERLQEQIKEVEMKEGEARHAQRARTAARLVLAQPPIEALKPSRPNFPIYLGGGFALSVLVGVGLAFLREFTDKTIRTPLDVVRAGQLPVLGCIPALDEEEADVDEIELATRRAPHSLVAEAFRQTRTNLQFSGPAESQRTLLVTSSGPGDGKTAVAINLAVTLAQGNERVLLVDCNFRRPAIRGAFRDTRPEGLSNILIGQGRLEELVTRTEMSNLDVLSSGPMPPTPAELLGSKYMAALLKAASERYDRVILDGPPALLVSDALVMANQVGGVILVARAVHNSKGAFKRAREQLERINGRVVGAVLNGVAPRPGGYFKQQYRDFYDYTSEEGVPPALPPDQGLPGQTAPEDQS